MSARPPVRIQAWPSVVIALALGMLGELAWDAVSAAQGSPRWITVYSLTIPGRTMELLQMMCAMASFLGDGPYDPALAGAARPFGWLAPFASALVYLPFVHLARLAPRELAARRRARARVSTTGAGMLLLLALPRAAPAEELAPVRLLDRCPREHRACVRMTVSTVDERAVAVPAAGPDAEGYADFVVRVRGSLDGDATGERDVIVRGYVDGIECTSFGQSTVAVVELAQDGSATLLTTRGALRLDPGLLSIGCPTCVAAAEHRGALTTPASDLILTGHRDADIFETRDGELAVRQGDGCVVLDGRFTWHPSAECAELRSDRTLEIRGEACT